jgi:tetratricopeptide (TPR) repeat protein
MAAVVLVIVLPSFVMRQISTWQTRGQHGLALAAGRALYACYPPIRGDVFFMLQLAQSEAATHRDDPSRLAFAKGVEFWRENRLDLARRHFEQSLEQDDHFLTRGYLSATLLRQGVLLFQQAQPAAAAATFKRVCDVFPGHIQATYFAMVAEAANADFVASAKSAAELRELQRYFRLPGIAAIGQSHLHAAWADFRAGRFDAAWEDYRKSVDRGAWQ